MTLPLIFVVACASTPAAPRRVVMTVAVPPTVSPPTSATSFENDWHAPPPRPLPGTGRDAHVPLYLVARSRFTFPAPTVADLRDGTTVFAYGADLAIVDGGRLAFDRWRARTKDPSERAETVATIWGESASDFWVTTKVLPEETFRTLDPFLDYGGSHHRFRSGVWTRFPTLEGPVPYRTGALLFDLPRFEETLPLFWGTETTGPDLTSLKSKLKWTREKGTYDYRAVVDPSGSVYVFLRALDLEKKRPTFGIVSWTEKQGARFEPVGEPLSLSKPISVDGALGKDGRARFDVTETVSGAIYDVTQDPRGWSAKLRPPPKAKPLDSNEGYSIPEHGAEVEGYRVSRGGTLDRRVGPGPDDWDSSVDESTQGLTLSSSKKGDLWALRGDVAYHSIPPEETLVLTEVGGRLHPWPAEATDDCPHPFLVLDALEPKTYDALLAQRRADPKSVGSWGAVPPGFESRSIVETRLFGHVIIGAAFPTMTDARAALTRSGAVARWGASYIDGARDAAGIVCARPVAPTPFPR